MSRPVAPDRAPRPQTVLTAQTARRLTPHLVRLTLGGERIAAFHARLSLIHI